MFVRQFGFAFGFALFAISPVLARGFSSADLVDSARKQVGVTVTYNPEYVRLKYPGGDIPASKGVCTDVVIRALRSVNVDLQKAIHEDWKSSPKSYGGKKPDANIDHRRVANQMIFFKRKGKSLKFGMAHQTYKPGDFVAWRLPNKRLHIGVVTDRKSSAGNPLIVHNIGRGAQEEDVLFAWDIIGQYRWFSK